jgi:hypothetical protein
VTFCYDNTNNFTHLLATNQEILRLLRSSELVKFMMTIGWCNQVKNEQKDIDMQIGVRNQLVTDVVDTSQRRLL